MDNFLLLTGEQTSNAMSAINRERNTDCALHARCLSHRKVLVISVLETNKSRHQSIEFLLQTSIPGTNIPRMQN